MKLYGIMLSPFVARARMALRFKGVAYDMEPPPGGSPRSADYLAINPIGKLPVLVTDEGTIIAESETIVDYLDDAFPEPSLQPAGTAERARMRNIVRCFELYDVPALSRLFTQLDPATRDAAVVKAELAQFRNGLSLTDRFVDAATFAVGGAPSKADCILLPSLLLCGVIADIFGWGDIVADYPNLAAYREKARQHKDMGLIWSETAEALDSSRAQAAS